MYLQACLPLLCYACIDRGVRKIGLGKNGPGKNGPEEMVPEKNVPKSKVGKNGPEAKAAKVWAGAAVTSVRKFTAYFIHISRFIVNIVISAV